MKDSIVLYASYAEKFQKLSDEQFGKLFRMMFKYQSEGVVPESDDIAISLAFDAIKYDVDRNNQRYEEICEQRRIAGAKGGIAKASKSKQMVANANKSKQNLANVADKDNDNDKDNDKDNEIKKKRELFKPPTIEEVKAYCEERKNGVDADTFVDFYAAKGWMVGSNKMKDWKACVRTWEKRHQKTGTQQAEAENEATKKRHDKYDELTRYYLGEE